MDSDGAVADATAFAASQLRGAGDGSLNVIDLVLHAGGGSPSATITGPDGSLDLRVDRFTGTPSVHLVAPGFPQHGTSDPIDTQLGVNLGATVIGVPDADLLAVVERAVPVLDIAQGTVDAARVDMFGSQMSVGEAAHVAALEVMDDDAIQADGHPGLVVDEPYFGLDPASTQLWGSEREHPDSPSVEVRATSRGGDQVSVRDGITAEKLDAHQVGKRLSLTVEQAVAVVQQTGYQLRRGQVAYDSANPALTRQALLGIDRDGPTGVHWSGVTPVPATAGLAHQRPDPSAPLTFAQGKALTGGTHDVEAGSSVSVAARARASFEAGGSAITQALARLTATRTPVNHRDDRPHHAHGGPSIR